MAEIVQDAELVMDHTALRQVIRQCEGMDDFVRVYDSSPYQMTLRTLRVAQGIRPVEEWAMEWAVRMRHESHDQRKDIEFNECRKSALLLVYELCNRWKDQECTDITDESLVNEFKGHRLSNILQLTLPMDRAQCLYKMIYPAKTAYGMHWAAEAHTDQPIQENSTIRGDSSFIKKVESLP